MSKTDTTVLLNSGKCQGFFVIDKRALQLELGNTVFLKNGMKLYISV